jgi:hypothetical protein
LLDVIVMLDASGSMSDKTSAGPSKWAAVQAALDSFAKDPQSAGLFVSLGFFPITHDGVPDSCTSDAQCGDYGPCMNKACEIPAPSNSTILPCYDDSNCSGGAHCVVLGVCQGDKGYLCTNVGGSCGAQGACGMSTGSSCDEHDSCHVDADYGTPKVPLAVLPGNGAALVGAMKERTPSGQTPTSAALKGAVKQAEAARAASPGHKQTIVLATDGVPTKCDTDTDDIAAIAAGAAAESIKTFVIGVLAPADTDAAPTLASIATAGGTDPVVVDTSKDTTKAFLDALNVIRGKALPCSFPVPAPSANGGAVDFGLVNVDVTVGGDSNTLGNVDNAKACDASTGGWYYDDANHPQNIELCPASCADVKSDGMASVDILMGCATVHALR